MTLRRQLLLLVALSIVALFVAEVESSNAGTKISSCRNHASFVAHALRDHVAREGGMPHERYGCGEEVFCRIDFGGIGQNCHAGAPGQGHGGWQMLNVSPDAWSDIFRAFGGRPVPAVWCGRRHYRPALFRAPADQGRVIVYAHAGFGFEARYASESGLQEDLRAVNAILAERGDPVVELDVTGRQDYWAIHERLRGQ